MKRTLSNEWAIGVMTVAFAMFIAFCFIFAPIKCNAENNKKWNEMHTIVVANEELLENAYHFNEEWWLDVLMETDMYCDYVTAYTDYVNKGDLKSLEQLMYRQTSLIAFIDKCNKCY